jgi:hypothetical protein
LILSYFVIILVSTSSTFAIKTTVEKDILKNDDHWDRATIKGHLDPYYVNDGMFNFPLFWQWNVIIEGWVIGSFKIVGVKNGEHKSETFLEDTYIKLNIGFIWKKNYDVKYSDDWDPYPTDVYFHDRPFLGESRNVQVE